MKQVNVLPIERLGRWDGSTFVPVAPGSVVEQRVHVMTHGWGPGMRPVIDAADGFVRVWDPGTETEAGSRFDRWFAPLAEAIVADDPDAVVLAYSWIDESATGDGVTKSVKSQMRTTVNGQRMAVAIRHALAGGDHDLHILGYSHGAKVATVAAALVDPQPRHLTILDSPDSLLPALGGALNDLSSYLRLLSPEMTMDESFSHSGEIQAEGAVQDERRVTFVDNYPSQYGRRYGSDDGAGAVVDVVLDPKTFPLDEAPSDHAYAWTWYLETVRNPELGIGFAWSPVRTGPPPPERGTYRQVQDGDDPWAIEEDPESPPASLAVRLRSRVGSGVPEVQVLTSDHPRTRGYFWRRSGDLWATGTVTWVTGPDDAQVSVYANGVERARSVKGWSVEPQRIMRVPLGGTRAGPMFVTIELTASEPARVEVGQAAAVNGIVLPPFAELAAWLRPLFWAGVAGILTGFAAWILSSFRRRRRAGGR